MKQYMVDAFAEKCFEGNQAAVCVMDNWLSDKLMQSIAQENKISETAFLVREGDVYHLRWFTPGGEIDLCGHGTLAAAYVILRFFEPLAESVDFDTLSGRLTVKRQEKLLELNFPAYDLLPVEITEQMTKAIGIKPTAAYMGRDLLCVLPTEADVQKATPDLKEVVKLDGLLLHITAKGIKTDCVSRTFSPKLDVTEDPVCGSGHCHIVPYWLEQLDKNELVAYQASERGGTLYCRQEGKRVYLAGKAVLFAISEIDDSALELT